MPGPELAQYGIGFFAVAGLLYIVTKFLTKRRIQDLLKLLKIILKP